MRSCLAWWTFACLAAGVGGIGLFARRERRSSSPLILPELHARRPFPVGAALTLLYFAAASGIVLVVLLYAQYRLGYSALAAGFVLAPAAMGNILGALISLRMQRRREGRQVIRIQLSVALLGLATIGLLAARGGLPAGILLATPIVVVGVGLGGVIGPLFSTILAGVGERETRRGGVGNCTAVRRKPGRRRNHDAVIAVAYLIAGMLNFSLPSPI